MSVTKTELGAKVDGVETQVGSLRTELTAKIDGVITALKAQNPLSSWQIFGIVIGTNFGGATLMVGILYGFLSIAGIFLAAPDNQSEITELLKILIA